MENGALLGNILQTIFELFYSFYAFLTAPIPQDSVIYTAMQFLGIETNLGLIGIFSVGAFSILMTFNIVKGLMK